LNEAEILLKYAWYMIGIWLEYEWNMNTVLEYEWNMNGI